MGTRPDVCIHLEPAGGQEARKPVLMLQLRSPEPPTDTSTSEAGSLRRREEEGAGAWKAGAEHSGAWEEGAVPFRQVSFQREGQNASRLLPPGAHATYPQPGAFSFTGGTSDITSA